VRFDWKKCLCHRLSSGATRKTMAGRNQVDAFTPLLTIFRPFIALPQFSPSFLHLAKEFCRRSTSTVDRVLLSKISITRANRDRSLRVMESIPHRKVVSMQEAQSRDLISPCGFRPIGWGANTNAPRHRACSLCLQNSMLMQPK